MLFVTSDSGAAQNPGDRIRVVIAGDTLTGDVTETSDTGLTVTLSYGMLSDYTQEREFTYGQIETLEVRTCCRDYAGLAAVGGGLLLGMGIGNAIGETCEETRLGLLVSETCTSSGRPALWGGITGVAVGLVAALTVLKDGWETVPPGARSAPSVAPSVGIRRSQAAPDVGNRVRVTIGGDVLTGDVFETSENGFTLAISQEELREISNIEVERLEVRTCCMDYAWALPTLAGVLVGGLVGAYAGDGIVCTETTVLGFGDESCEIEGTAFWWGILGGAAVGFVVGKAGLRENWKAMPIADRSGPTLSPVIDFGSGVHSNATMILGARIHF